jgi:hypothetical protein
MDLSAQKTNGSSAGMPADGIHEAEMTAYFGTSIRSVSALLCSGHSAYSLILASSRGAPCGLQRFRLRFCRLCLRHV